MKKHLFPALLLILVLTLCSCSNVTEEDEESFEEGLVSEELTGETDDKLSFSVFTLPYLSTQTLDPITCIDGVQQAIGSLVYEGLFTLDEQFTPHPTLCADYEYDAQSMTYRFLLRHDVRFSDGTPLTANDVLATLRRAQESDRYAARFASVVSMTATGSDTLRITLSENNVFFPALLDIPIVKSGTHTQLVPLGTGPYLFTNDASGASLAANGNWWRGETLPLERIALASVKDNSTAAHLFSAYNVQLLCSDLTGSEPAPTGGEIASYDVPSSVMQYVGFNANDPLLSDAALRSAMSAAIDRENIVAAFLSGHAQASEFPLHPASKAYLSAAETDIFPDAYRAALENAGVSSEKTKTLTMIVNEENAFKSAIAEKIASSLSLGGLNVKLKTLPWSEYLAALQTGNFDLYYAEVRLTADWNCSALMHSLGALNYGGYASEETNALLASFLAGESGSISAFLKAFSEQTPFAPIAFKSFSVLSPTGLIEKLTPTAGCTFYRIEDWAFHLEE